MPPAGRTRFNVAMEFLGQSPAARAVRQVVERVAPIDVTLLLTGESGSGKGLLARHIHAASRRCDGPFVTVSCPVLPRDLLESELFGHEKGAFTGASRSHAGAIERAQGGTLFLDEVGDLPGELQPKLLTILQDREYRRIGGIETRYANIRVIAATHVDLSRRVADGMFREDLFYRLNVVPIRVPPLRDRLEDLPALCARILSRIGASRSTTLPVLSAPALEALRSHRWPGNVRELENVLERATLLAGGGEVLPDDLPVDWREPVGLPVGRVAMAGEAGEQPRLDSLGGAPIPLTGLTLRAVERMVLAWALRDTRGNKAAAARALGISEKTIRNKLRRHGLGITSPSSPP